MEGRKMKGRIGRIRPVNRGRLAGDKPLPLQVIEHEGAALLAQNGADLPTPVLLLAVGGARGVVGLHGGIVFGQQLGIQAA